MTTVEKQLKAALRILETIDTDSLDFAEACNVFSAKDNLKAIIEPKKPSTYTPEKRQEVIHKCDVLMANIAAK